MDPSDSKARSSRTWFPRARGDGPFCNKPSSLPIPVSPRTRGWTPKSYHRLSTCSGFPAHAGMDPKSVCVGWPGQRFPRARGDGPDSRVGITPLPQVSPRTRGWTLSSRPPSPHNAGFPAHAGMDPCHPPDRRPDARFPRARGDGPILIPPIRSSCVVSPRTRGWTRLRHCGGGGAEGFPAHAGMDPPAGCASATG